MKANKTIRAEQLPQPEPIVRIVLYGTIIVVALLAVLLFIHYALLGNTSVLPRLGATVLVMIYVLTAAGLFAKRHAVATAWMLVVFYAAFGLAMLMLWGLNAPVGVLILGFTIMLTGIMLGARYIIGTMIVIISMLGILQVATDTGILRPDTSGLDELSTYLDVLSYCIIFILFAIVAWLAGRRAEQLLRKSQRAEAALQREKDLLSIRLEQKSREVHDAQLEEMRQLYQFAELGQLGMVLLHDLANNLTALTLDIDDIGRQMQRNESIIRAKESIAYLETMVNGVRRQIHERDKPIIFDAMKDVLETAAALRPKASRAGVTICCEPAKGEEVYIQGDPIRFTHILTILITNALDAYTDFKKATPSITVAANYTAKSLVITISDHGKGILKTEQDGLFKPFASSKPNGMGIGLFMAREMTEQYFKGTLILAPSDVRTTFKLSIPRAREPSAYARQHNASRR